MQTNVVLTAALVIPGHLPQAPTGKALPCPLPAQPWPSDPPASTLDPHLGPHNGAAGRSPSQELWSVQKTMTVNLVTGFSANVIPFY